MHAVVVKVTIQEGHGEEAAAFVNEQILPRVKASDGFVSGVWVHTNNRTNGTATTVYDSEENAQAAAAMAANVPLPDIVTGRDISVGLVVAQA